MGFRVVKDQIYYFTTPPPPSLPPCRPAAIFAPFSSDLGQPSLRGAPPPCPSHFYDLIQVSNFPINEHGGTGEQWVGRSEFLHVHDLHVPALETGRKRIRKLFFFFFRGPVPGSPDRSTRFQAINRPREIYTFMENLNVNKSIERECDMQSSGGVVIKGILLLLFII